MKISSLFERHPMVHMITGQQGVGKTAIMNKAFERLEGNKIINLLKINLGCSLVSTIGGLCRAILKQSKVFEEIAIRTMGDLCARQTFGQDKQR